MPLKRIILITLLAYLFPIASHAELNAKLAGVLICAEPLPKKLMIMACNMGGDSTINFYAEGQDLVSIDENSLVLDQLRIGQTDLLKAKDGEANYELGPFSEIKDDGKLAVWDIQIDSGLQAMDGKLTIKGTLTAYTGDGVVLDESALFDWKKYTDMQIGPVKLIGKTTTSTSDDDGQIELRVEYDEAKVQKITLQSASGEELSSRGTMTMNGAVTQMFERPESGKIKLIVSYQKNIKPVTITIDL